MLNTDNNAVAYSTRTDVAEVTQCKPKNFKTKKFPKKTGTECAYESLLKDMDERIIYDPLVDDLNLWLDSNLPSVLSREDRIGTICVKSNRSDEVDDLCDYERLFNGWKELKESGKVINYYSIKDLAKESNVVSGKWILHVATGCKVDIIWRKLAKEMTNGVLTNVATRANVTPREPEKDNFIHIVTIHNDDYTNESSVLKLNSALREAGVKSKLKYKPDVYTRLGIFRNNEWKMRPSIFESSYDILKKESTVTPLYDKLTNFISN